MEKHHMRATSAEIGGACLGSGCTPSPMLWPTPKTGCGTAVNRHATSAGPRPLGLEFDYVQLAGRPAPGEKDPWNADALMEGVRAGAGRGDFLADLEDRVKAEEVQWAPLLQLHFPDQLDDYLNKVLVETGQRFFKKEPMDAPGYADLAAVRRELLTQRLEHRSGPSPGAGRLGTLGGA